MKEKRWLLKCAALLVLFACIIAVPKRGQAAGGSSAFERQELSALLAQGKFSVSSQKVTLKADEKANGVMIEGSASDLSSVVFSLKDSFVFGKEQADYLLVDALAERKKNIKLDFFLDNEKTAFATVELGRQKKKELWSTVMNRCIRLDKTKLTGSHKLSFRASTKEAGNLKLVFRSLFFMKNDIPMVELNLDESQGSIAAMHADEEHDTECYGTMTLKIPQGYKSEYTDKKCETQTYSLDYIRGRGNSTWSAPKKPYKIKLENKQDLLGMGANKHWILLANYYDVTMLRNKVTYWLGQQLGMEFTPKCEFVNVIMNEEYIGSYYLCEQVRVGKARVDIDDLEKDEATMKATDEKTISGGYLLSLYPYGDESKRTFRTERGVQFLIESPSFEEYYNKIQEKYIIDFVQKTENAIYGKEFKDSSGKAYQEYMDIDAAIDYYWIQEVSLNGDGFGSTSTYLYKKRNGKLFWGPLWDFDYVAWGATEYTENYVSGYLHNDSVWFGRLFNDPVFCNKVIARWKQIREKLLEAAASGGQIDKYSKKQYESQKHNYEIWKMYSEYVSYDFDDGSGPVMNQITYDTEVERFKQWIRERVEWIDANLDKFKKEYRTVTFVVDDTEIAKIQVPENQEGAMMEMPPEPVKEGYVFSGWYVSVEYDGEEFQYPFIPEQGIDKDITVKAKWKAKADVKPLEAIAFTDDEINMDRQDYINIAKKLSVFPFDAPEDEITFTSSNEAIVSVVDEKGYIMSRNMTGTAVITASTPGGITASTTVHVTQQNGGVGAVDFRLATKEILVMAGDYARIQTEAVPKSARMYEDLMFDVVDKDIAEVDKNGFVYGKKEGASIIAIYSIDMGIKYCKVTVTKNDGTKPTPRPTPSVTPVPKPTPTGTVSPTPAGTQPPAPSDSPVPSVKPVPVPSVSALPTVSPAPVVPGIRRVKPGMVFAVHGIRYKVLSVKGNRKVSCMGAKSKKIAKLVVPDSVKYKGKKYAVTEISARAFANCKKLQRVEIGHKVVKIGEGSFLHCKKLKRLTVLSSRLCSVGKHAVKGAPSRMKLTVPKGRRAKYRKLFGI